mmetsp:Transcript_61799/g.135177  ORF Transcript_61799/g.135177 Transcript_61799/m.135177 type:complete len:249 (-) Transcript_61799:874-1620(-)
MKAKTIRFPCRLHEGSATQALYTHDPTAAATTATTTIATIVTRTTEPQAWTSQHHKRGAAVHTLPRDSLGKSLNRGARGLGPKRGPRVDDARIGAHRNSSSSKLFKSQSRSISNLNSRPELEPRPKLRPNFATGELLPRSFGRSLRRGCSEALLELMLARLDRRLRGRCSQALLELFLSFSEGSFRRRRSEVLLELLLRSVDWSFRGHRKLFLMARVRRRWGFHRPRRHKKIARSEAARLQSNRQRSE